MTELAEGTVVAARYQVERELARGGMGAVYVAKDLKFAVRCALKVASGAGLTDTVALKQRFQREARIANALGKSEHFVRVFDWGEVEGSGRLFLAMDLVEDAAELDVTTGELPDRLERVEAACRVVAQLHRLGVIHRDIKPANFLVGKDGKLRLTDFGIAKVLTEPEDATAVAQTQAMGLTGTGMAMGTPYYMPPEQFDDAKSVDERADVYALGVMLFNALAGRVPYAGDNASQVLATQMRVRFEGRPAPRPRDFSANIPVALDQVAARAIHLDPAQRFPTADELLAALERTEWRKALPRGGTARRGPPSRTLDATEVDAGPTKAALQAAATEPERPAGRVIGKRDRGPEATISTAPAPPPPPIRPRSELGAGLDHAGVAIPRGVWFIVGILVATGVAVNALPKLRQGDEKKAPPPRVDTAAPIPISGTDRPRDEVVALADLPDYDRPEAELFSVMHAAWVKRVREGSAPEESTPEELGAFDAGALGRIATTFTLVRFRAVTREGRTIALSEAESKTYRFEAVEEQVQILRRGGG